MNLNGDGKKEKLTEPEWWWGSRPHLSADGQSLYFTGPPRAGTFYRLELKENAQPQPLTQLERQLTRALVSPDGKWLAFKRNTEIWVAPLGAELVREENVRRLSRDGGYSFTFTPDGSAVIYAAGNRVWRHPLDGREREEIPIRLALPRPTPPPTASCMIQFWIRAMAHNGKDDVGCSSWAALNASSASPVRCRR